MLGQPQSAVADCTAAIRFSPRNSLIRYNRRIAYALQGNMTRAALDFDTAIRLRPNYVPAYCSRENDTTGAAAQHARRRIESRPARFRKPPAQRPIISSWRRGW